MAKLAQLQTWRQRCLMSGDHCDATLEQRPSACALRVHLVRMYYSCCRARTVPCVGGAELIPVYIHICYNKFFCHTHG